MSIRKKLLFLCLLFVALLTAAETGLRLRQRWAYGDASARFYLNLRGAIFDTHPYLHYVLKPGLDRVNFMNQHVISTNSLGFRGPEVVVPKPAGVYRIVCIGASTTFNADASDDEHAWPWLLQ